MRQLALTPEKASTILSRLNFSSKLEMLISLLQADQSNEIVIKKLRRMVNEASRNHLVHSIAAMRADKFRFIKREAKGKYEVKEKSFTLAEVRQHVLSFLSLANQLHAEFQVSEEDINAYIQHMLVSRRDIAYLE